MLTEGSKKGVLFNRARDLLRVSVDDGRSFIGKLPPNALLSNPIDAQLTMSNEVIAKVARTSLFRGQCLYV